MTIFVELFGIARQRAGRGILEVETRDDNITLGDVLLALGSQYPALAEECFVGRRLREPYVANVGGERFVTEPDTQLDPGDSLLILSADAGG